MASRLLVEFCEMHIQQLPGKENARVDVLSKLASSHIIEQKGKILFEHREVLSYEMAQVYSLRREENWMTLTIRMMQDIPSWRVYSIEKDILTHCCDTYHLRKLNM
ncbi:hypothetical protein EPI10_001606 [Gossypium australe]|uniref:Uncharacterized protein n=1 Tax=Gossypium australe TaxID=47621 RepID=A0A5B6VBK7_9ROSI|nr:hypothetical protein EPI10_001606 [Gossypium australe]